MLPVVAQKTKRFENSNEKFDFYFLKHGNDEVTMTLSETGAELKMGTTKIDAPVWTTLNLYKIDDNAKASDTEISLSDIIMGRTWSKKAAYTEPDADDYEIKVSVIEYYEDGEKKEPTLTDADQQQVKFIFPEEKKDNAEDGGIRIRYLQRF